MRTFAVNDKLQASYATFLNLKGRIIFDALIIRPHKFMNGSWQFAPDEFWLDVHRSQISTAKKHLTKHLFRKKAQLYDLEGQLTVLSLFVDEHLTSSLNRTS